jgi:hypothetical protein
MEQLDLDIKNLIKMNSKQSINLHSLQSPTFLTPSNLKKNGTNPPSKRESKTNLLYLNSDFINPNEKSKILNLHAHKKRKSLGYNVDQKDDNMKTCKKILQILMNHKDAWIFNEPIDPMKLGISNYHSIIKHPMYLGTINENLKANYYFNTKEFVYDIRLTFLNAMTFNPIGHYVHKIAQTLLRLFEQHWNKESVKYPLYKKNKVNKSTLILQTKVNIHYDFICYNGTNILSMF